MSPSGTRPPRLGGLVAIIRHTILYAARMRAPLVLTLGVSVLVPCLTVFVEGDNTVIGLLRVVFNYNFAIALGKFNR